MLWLVIMRVRAAFILAGLSILTSCGLIRNEPLVRSEFVLGTVCTIAIHDGKSAGVMENAFTAVREIDRRMSLHRPESEINAVNGEAGRTAVSVSDDTFSVVRRAVAFSSLSGGAFDPTVGPLVRLWGIGTDNPRVPAAAEIAAALPLVDARRILLLEEGRKILLRDMGMAIDLGGIAKGFAADRAVAILSENGVSSALLDFGGNIFAMGTKRGGKPWRIAVQDPREERGSFIGVVPVIGKAVVTSGTYERYFVEDGTRYHHILDTGTGYPVRNGLAGVTIVADTSMTADALSTAVFALGLSEGLELVNDYDGVEAIIVDTGNRIYLSSGLDGSFELTNDNFSFGKIP